MHNVSDLLELIKEIAVNAVRAEEPMEIQYGTVKSLNPFVIDMGEFTLEDDFLILSRTIKGLMKSKGSCHGNCAYGPGTQCRFGELKSGDTVALLKDAGGDDWLVIDAVEVEDDGE